MKKYIIPICVLLCSITFHYLMGTHSAQTYPELDIANLSKLQTTSANVSSLMSRGLKAKNENHLDLACAYYSMAIKKCQHAIKLDPQLTDAYYNISRIYSMQNKKDDAFEWLKQTLECNRTTKEISKKEFLDQPELFNIKHDKRFKRLLDQYFPSN